jgi:hypothetical protein
LRELLGYNARLGLLYQMNITAGTRLGRYEIRAKIGEGGMGEVYLAILLEPGFGLVRRVGLL